MPSHTNRITIEIFEVEDNSKSYRVYDEQLDQEWCGLQYPNMKVLVKRLVEGIK